MLCFCACWPQPVPQSFYPFLLPSPYSSLPLLSPPPPYSPPPTLPSSYSPLPLLSPPPTLPSPYSPLPLLSPPLPTLPSPYSPLLLSSPVPLDEMEKVPPTDDDFVGPYGQVSGRKEGGREGGCHEEREGGIEGESE